MNTHSTSYRAHTKEEKREIVERLYLLWREYPQLRLGQLLANISSDLYSVEDFDLISTLEQRYRKLQEEG